MPGQSELQSLERIIKLEYRLATTIERLDTLIQNVEKKHDSLSKLYQGDSNTPSMLSRIIDLERFKATANWTVGVLYAAVVAVIVKLILEK